MNRTETTDVLVIGSDFGGAIPAYHLAAGGAKVVVLERGPYLRTEDFTHDLKLGTFTRFVDLVQNDGMTVVAGNCVGGSSVVYFAASLRAPSFVFDRTRGTGARQWPKELSRQALDPWYDRVEETIPVAEQGWDDVPYAGGVFAAACRSAGRTCNPVPVAVDLAKCTNCNFTGTVQVGERAFPVRDAPGAVARIYGHGNARRWGWLHADLGGGDVLELVAAVSTRPVMRHLPPLPLLQLRVGGRDWPRDPLLAAPLLRATLGQPEWSVRGHVGRRRVRVTVRQDPAESVTLRYDNPNGDNPDSTGPVCVNSERADAEVLIERWTGRWATEHYWQLDHTAHAEIGRTDPLRA